LYNAAHMYRKLRPPPQPESPHKTYHQRLHHQHTTDGVRPTTRSQTRCIYQKIFSSN
jgi:hypothetical protein